MPNLWTIMYILKVINYSVNKKHRDLRRTKLLTDIGSKQQELKINQELTFDKWYIETHPR